MVLPACCIDKPVHSTLHTEVGKAVTIPLSGLNLTFINEYDDS